MLWIFMLSLLDDSQRWSWCHIPFLPDMKSTACPLWGLFAHLQSASTAPIKPLLTTQLQVLPPFITTHLSQALHHCKVAAASSAVSCIFSNGLPRNKHRLEPHSPSLFSKVQGTTLPFKHPSQRLVLFLPTLFWRWMNTIISGRFRNKICKFQLLIISITRFPVPQFASHKVKTLTSHLYISWQHRVQVTQEPLLHCPKALWRDLHSNSSILLGKKRLWPASPASCKVDTF